MLFGIPAEKDEQGSGAWDEEGVVQLATRAIKQAQPELLVITDVCLCEYTDARPLRRAARRTARSTTTRRVELLARTAVSHARAGADIVAPSDMMDGRVGAIRAELDGEGFADTPILAYSAKFASAFYGPFREAAGSTPAFGDRRAYQMDPANGREAVREALLDVRGGRRHGDGQAGARLRRPDPRGQATRRGLPVAAYNVSGEYAMVKAAAAAGLPRRARDGARDPHLAAPRRRRHDHHLPRKGRGPMAGRAELIASRAPTPTRAAPRRRRSAAARTARRCRSTTLDRRLLNLMQGSFPIAPRPYAARGRAGGASPRSEVMARVQRLLDKRIIRQVTPIFDTRALGYSSMLVAAKVDPEHPHRAAQVINEHPGVSHNYLRNHDFNLWFTIATEPDSRARPGGHARGARARGGRRVGAPAADAEAVQDPHGPRDGGRHRGARERAPRRASRSSSSPQPYDELDIAVIRALQGDMPVVAEPYAPAAAALGMTPAGAPRPPRGHAGARAAAPRGGDPLPPPRRLLGERHGRVEGARGADLRASAARMAAVRGISHCYQRPTYEDWPYSVFTMAHGRSKEECDAVLDAIAEQTGIHERATLYSSTEFKKIRLLYFTDDFKDWEREHA